MTSNQPRIHRLARTTLTLSSILGIFVMGFCTAASPQSDGKTVGSQEHRDAALMEGLLGHWKFDGDFSDSSAHSKNGRPIDAPKFGKGKVGQALQLNGRKQCVEIPVLGADITQFTLAAWMYVDAMPSPQTFVGIYHNDGWEDGDVHLPFTSEDGTMDLGIKGNEPMMCVPTFKVKDMQKRWVHLAVTYDTEKTKQVRFYVNGKLTDTFDIETGHPVRLGPGRIGGWDVEDRGFLGRLDDMYIYKRSLLGKEVKAIFARGDAE